MSHPSAKKSKKETYRIPNPVRASAAFAMSRPRHVSIEETALERFAAIIAKQKMPPPESHLAVHDPKQLLTYLFVLDTLNFCYWPYPHKNKKWAVKYRGKSITGYYALSCALKDWFQKYPEQCSFAYFSSITWKDFKKMMQGGLYLQWLDERWQNLRAVSRVFIKKYGGDPQKFVAQAKGNAAALTLKIAKELPSFDDKARYHGREVWFLKRAQILVNDIHSAFGGRGFGTFRNMDWLTIFPDYKLPQVLETFGVIRYSPSLEAKIAQRILIKKSSQEEIEIRAATVLAVERLRNELSKLGVRLKSFEIDWLLWNLSQKEKMRLPHHYTKTMYY